MDIKNITSSGPAYGLLDIIFGTVPNEKEAEEMADGEKFDPLLAVLQKLETKNIIEEPTMSIKNMKTESEDIGMKFNDISVKMPVSDEKNLTLNNNRIQFNEDISKAIQNKDTGKMMDIIEKRKSQLKEEMPSLVKLEKVIDKKGVNQFSSMDSIAKLVKKLESEISKQEKSVSTEDFIRINKSNEKKVETTKKEGSTDSNTKGEMLFNAESATALKSKNEGVKIIKLDSLHSLGSTLAPKLATNLNYIANQGGGEMRIIFTPENFGEMQVRVSTQGDNVNVKFIVENSEVASALRSEGQNLKEALFANNLRLNGVEVIVRDSNDLNSFENEDKQNNSNKRSPSKDDTYADHKQKNGQDQEEEQFNLRRYA